jgi:hypothetical protein
VGELGLKGVRRVCHAAGYAAKATAMLLQVLVLWQRFIFLHLEDESEELLRRCHAVAQPSPSAPRTRTPHTPVWSLPPCFPLSMWAALIQR